MRIGILWTGAILLCGRLAFGQVESNQPSEESPFFVDHVGLLAQDRFTYVEIFVQIGYNRLHFTRHGKHYQAVYDIDFYVEDQDGNVVQTQSARDTVRACGYDETGATDNYRITRAIFYLRPARYRLRAICTDRETGKSSEIAGNFSARDFSGSQLMLSDLQFSRNIQPDTSANPFVKHNRWVEPNVLHLYGQSSGRLYVYYEIYNLSYPVMVDGTANMANHNDVTKTAAPVDSFRTLYVIQDDNGQEVKRLWKASRKPGSSYVQSVALPIEDLPSGQYTLVVRVFDDQAESSAEVAGRFSMYWHLFSFKDQNFETVLEQMRFVATREELRKFSQLPEAGRQRGLIEFWQRRDPTPGTPQNELMDEYYRRIGYANRHFKWFGGQGWKSPQGEIYITYGQPDEIHRYANAASYQASHGLIPRRTGWPTNGNPWFVSPISTGGLTQFDRTLYEVWEYHQLSKSFVFVDRYGMGTYELIDPLSVNGSWGR